MRDIRKGIAALIPGPAPQGAGFRASGGQRQLSVAYGLVASDRLNIRTMLISKNISGTGFTRTRPTAPCFRDNLS
jgi:hypothetical protein